MKREIYILSGFLGSGKTTLLKQMVSMLKKQGKKPAVLMNELGKVSIDSDEVEEGIPLAELLDGCICCTIQEKLESQLQELLFNKGWDVLIIETTGAAHPVEVLDSVMSPLFADHWNFKGIITIVDVLQWDNREFLSPQVLQLLREQIRHSHLLLLNKTDLLSENAVGKVVFEIQSINSSARTLITTHSKLSLKDIEALQTSEEDILNSISTRDKKQLSLQSFVYTFTNSVDQEQFENWLRKSPDTIYRMKGYIPFTGFQYPYSFQYSYGMPMFLPEDMNMPKNLVIIGEQLKVDELKNQLKKLEQTENTPLQ
ncbi:CobW family GTP-binding protein [Bacillus sp. 2205SS5-2]|uniref:CobW family GTP-binding protein n=1 Tax=Bacillus sp. 2205SS5-2 TaxID=3109031 RepID=UPI003007D0B3